MPLTVSTWSGERSAESAMGRWCGPPIAPSSVVHAGAAMRARSRTRGAPPQFLKRARTRVNRRPARTVPDGAVAEDH
jgi:hypothetical protein